MLKEEANGGKVGHDFLDHHGFGNIKVAVVEHQPKEQAAPDGKA